MFLKNVLRYSHSSRDNAVFFARSINLLEIVLSVARSAWPSRLVKQIKVATRQLMTFEKDSAGGSGDAEKVAGDEEADDAKDDEDAGVLAI
eukprot:SAG31_NODE_5819_length_2310_cov_1.677069_1_plen_91_part_00